MKTGRERGGGAMDEPGSEQRMTQCRPKWTTPFGENTLADYAAIDSGGLWACPAQILGGEDSQGVATLEAQQGIGLVDLLNEVGASSMAGREPCCRGMIAPRQLSHPGIETLPSCSLRVSWSEWTEGRLLTQSRNGCSQWRTVLHNWGTGGGNRTLMGSLGRAMRATTIQIGPRSRRLSYGPSSGKELGGREKVSQGLATLPGGTPGLPGRRRGELAPDARFCCESR